MTSIEWATARIARFLPRRQTPVLRTQVGTLRPRGGVRRLSQGGPQEAIALAGLARQRPAIQTPYT